jgi:hypothetical protein
MHATFPTDLILLDSIILMFDDEYKLWTHLTQFSPLSCHMGQNVLNTSFKHPKPIYPSTAWETKQVQL